MYIEHYFYFYIFIEGWYSSNDSDSCWFVMSIHCISLFATRNYWKETSFYLLLFLNYLLWSVMFLLHIDLCYITFYLLLQLQLRSTICFLLTDYKSYIIKYLIEINKGNKVGKRKEIYRERIGVQLSTILFFCSLLGLWYE